MRSQISSKGSKIENSKRQYLMNALKGYQNLILFSFMTTIAKDNMNKKLKFLFLHFLLRAP